MNNLTCRLSAIAITLSLGSVYSQEASPIAPLEIICLDESPIAISAKEFKELPRRTVRTKDRDGTESTYGGVDFYHILEKSAAPIGESLRAGALRCFVSVEATDGYRVVFALPEFDPAFTDRKIILADELNGKPLPERLGDYQIVIPEEKRHARWVRMVAKIRILESKIPAEPGESKQ